MVDRMRVCSANWLTSGAFDGLDNVGDTVATGFNGLFDIRGNVLDVTHLCLDIIHEGIGAAHSLGDEANGGHSDIRVSEGASGLSKEVDLDPLDVAVEAGSLQTTIAIDPVPGTTHGDWDGILTLMRLSVQVDNGNATEVVSPSDPSGASGIVVG